MAKCKSVCLLLLALYGLLEVGNVFGAPAPSTTAEKDGPVATRRSSRRRNTNADPTEALEIPSLTEMEAENLLNTLGYNETDGMDLTPRLGFSEEQTFEQLIRIFQRDNDLEETGILDDETKLMIDTPHCGTTKKRASKGDGERKWSKNTLSYRIKNFPSGKRSGPIRELLSKAFSQWSKVTNLDFYEVNDVDADIEITFGGTVHRLRGDRCSFEDPKTLAHAYFPETGDIHFNSKYFFESGTSLEDFLDTALHEIGHSLGLEHTASRASLMHPTESNQFTEPQPMDVENIQALYGTRKSRGTSISNFSPPKFCSLKKIDAAIVDEDDTTFVFAGNFYYIPSENPPKARLISSKWPGLPGNIDAAFRFTDGRSYFFKGTKYWRFRGSRLEAGHPRLIKDGFRGLPNSIDAAFVDADGDIFAFKGGQYWIYDSSKKRTYAGSPKPISNLRGVTAKSIDAALDNESDIWTFKGRSFFEATTNGFKEFNNGWFEC
ncbi:matrix metalloproteinase-18-like [Uranotaenia lowii]|uniref:matrix metalloproteinase-18-like n=1 Tax=Uranotaenia lowii TaxID=190385 RepID=UPI00247AEF02|nr:matrix metalloproteinase-18-like [Uranotaenia lowii]